jgi:hypothetical protein
VLAGTVSAVAFFVGIFDRPDFTKEDALTKGERELYCLVATTNDKNIGNNDARLSEGTLKGILATEKGKQYMETDSKLYTTPEGAERMRIGLCFDDPAETNLPRWAVGWVLASNTVYDIRDLVERVQKESKLDEPIRAVRLGREAILRAPVPWRSSLTPAIGAMLHWSRAFAAYKSLDLTSDCGRAAIENGSVAVELFVTGKNDSFHRIDYILMVGNTRNIWDDAFPPVHTPDNIETWAAATFKKQPSRRTAVEGTIR